MTDEEVRAECSHPSEDFFCTSVHSLQRCERCVRNTKVQYLQRAELLERLAYQWEGQSLNGCQPEVTTTHLTSELNSAPCYSPETWLGQLNHVNVSPVNELLDNPPFPYSRLTAPVDFNWTLHHSHCPAPGRLSAVSGEMMMERV